MHVDTPQGVCQAGLARGDITPPVGIYHRMWGAATHDRSTGVHRPLTATALALRPAAAAHDADSDAGVVLLAIDHCLLWSQEMAALLAQVSAGAGIPRDRVFVMFSHTHSAGLMGHERAELPGGELIAPYLDDLARRLAALARQAVAALAPAVITYGLGRCGLAAQRDFYDSASGQWVCGLNPAGAADDTLLVARITDAQGHVRGAVVNYACHPTTLAWQNTLISPDYVGAMREVVETATAAPCFFIQGASGDLGPRRGYTGELAVAESNGRQLGYAALAALEALPPPATRHAYQGPVVSGAVLGSWSDVPLDDDARRQKTRWQFRSCQVDLPYREGLPTVDELSAERRQRLAEETAAQASGDEAAARDCRARVEVLTRQLVRFRSLPAGPAYPFPVQLWRIGDGIWVAVEAEHYQLLQVELRRRFPQIPLVIATLVNGSLHTYLPPKDVYGAGIYQETIALLAPGCLERLIDEISRQVERLWSATAEP